ncbi:MAG TPA: outer membrane lipoprotein carrier protein LolA [Gemmatimonadales bacterium]|nr:outer membrane lipoprotein carrier protein LolA [Gemmatimonadales bacterium]
MAPARTCLALVAVSAFTTFPRLPQDVDAVLARAQRAYDAMRTLRAEFTQTLDNPMLGSPESSHGTMYLAPPGKFAMAFSDPAGDRIVADGEWLWIYTPSSVPDQVIRQPIPAAGANTPNLFQQFVDRPRERYVVTLVRADTAAGERVDVVRLVPRREGMPFREAIMAVAQRDGWPRRLSLVEESGQRREFTFRDIMVNVEIPARDLRFTVPRGARVVTP